MNTQTYEVTAYERKRTARKLQSVYISATTFEGAERTGVMILRAFGNKRFRTTVRIYNPLHDLEMARFVKAV